MERDGSGSVDEVGATWNLTNHRVTEVQGGSDAAPRTPLPTSSGAGREEGPSGQLARYEILGLIGRGGMGEVLSAHDEQIGRSVAIKRLREGDASPDVVARFLREAKIQGRLDHPAIPAVHELWRDERGQPFFVMKQLSGITLAEVLRRLARGDGDAAQRFPRRVLLRAFVDVCLAIEFAHTRGVLHRDLKPANVMLGDFGEVYVLDWGVARVLAEGPHDVASPDAPADAGQTLAGVVLGTPGYMSPEQSRGETDLDGRTDVYALGCLLFELLAGAPLHASGHAGLAEAISGIDARPSLRAPDREIPPELDAVCVRATHLERAERFPSARAVGDAVQRYLDGDRDLATRAKLAAGELALAQAALDRGGAIPDRRAAIRAAARALALDPKSQEAAELVARLMIEPPPETPAEVERELAAIEEHALQSQFRLGAIAMLAYFLFFPILYVAGFRALWFAIGGPVVAAVSLGAVISLTRRPTMSLVYISFLGNAALVGMMARTMSPLLVAPSLAVIIAMVYAMHPRIGRGWILWSTLVLALLGPWLAEVSGLVPRTIFITQTGFELRVGTVPLDERIIYVSIGLYALVLLGLAVALARSLAVNRGNMQRALQLQAWQLRQLVPRSGIADSFAPAPRPRRSGAQHSAPPADGRATPGGSGPADPESDDLTRPDHIR